MAKKSNSNAYGKLVRVLIVLFVLLAICAAGYIMLDQSIKTQEDENIRLAAEENARLEEQYQQAKAEEEAEMAQGESEQWPQPKASGWDVVDLTSFPILNPFSAPVSRQEMLLGGMMLLNHWHAQPQDFPESELVGVHSVDKAIQVSSSRVQLFPAAITALSETIQAAKDAGFEGYIIDEGFRTNETQTANYQKEEAKYAEKLNGEALKEKVRQTVNYPGTSEYQSGFSFRIDRYKKGDTEFMSQKFQNMDMSDWLLAHSWEYGIVFRFPVQGYPNSTVSDKSYKTGESKKLSIYRYVGKGNAAVMHALDFCMEEYIEYLMAHPHIAVYENGELKYEIVRTPGGDAIGMDANVQISGSAKDYSVSMDNCGGLITVMSY
ncbi:MAG: D-alanyl-D-alanine carboxypeptidase family protein [Clostridia bacterium]|nr:D-alanyl-D-alanine carboxypeptidase family protein [Clostridia bacterium]